MKTNRVPIELAQQSFLISKESEGVSPKTLDTYRRMTDKFIGYVLEQGITGLEAITPSIVRAYFLSLSKQGFTTHTIHDHCRPVKTMLRFWHFDGMLDTDVMARIKMPQTDKNVQPAFTEDEVKSLLQNGCKSERDKALLLFLLDTGVRASELCDLTIADVDLSSGAVTVEHGKGDKRRMTFMGTKSKRALLKYFMVRGEYANDSPLFPAQSGEHLTPSGLFQLLERIGDRAGVKDVAPHKCRRTMAIFCLRAGMDVFRLAQLLGHSQVQILRQYLNILPSDLKEAHRQSGALDHMRI